MRGDQTAGQLRRLVHSIWIATWLLFVPSADAAAGTHRVERGDTLWTIARAHGCDVEAVRRANPQLRGTLRIGAVLELPRCGATVVQPRASEPREDAAPRVRRHHVKPGETLAGLAKRYRIPVAEIMRRNKLRSTTILVGRDLDVGDLPAAAAGRPRGSSPAVARADGLPSIADDVPPARPRASAKATTLADLPAPPAAENVDHESDDDGEVGPVAFGVARGTKGARGQSIGKPNHGKLVGGVQLPKDSAYHRRHPKRAFGATHVVELTRAAIAEVRRKHPRVHKLAIGDISDPDGGRLSGHRSHQSGRDVDVGLYFMRTPKSYPERFVGADEAPLHIAATWTLVDAFYRQSKRAGGPIAIFLDYDLQKRLVEYGRKHGVDKRVLREMFQYPGGRRSRTGFVRHEPGHDDHLHVRYGCPPRDRACG